MFQMAIKKFTQKGVKGVAKDLAPACILLFAGCFMLLIYEPILMYATNTNDFWFDLQIMIWPVLSIFFIFFLIGIIMIFAIYTIDLLVMNRLLLYKGIILTGFYVFFLLYLQGNWLAGSLPSLTGADIIWENYGKHESFVLISAAIFLVIAMTISLLKKGLDRTIFYSTVCASAVFLMLFAALIPTIMTNEALERKSDAFEISLKNYNTISSNKNFLIFLADGSDSELFYDIMMKDDDFRGMMEDFTYYPDTLSVYSNTFYSIFNILTGEVFYNETNFRDVSSNAFNHSKLFEKLAQNGYEINLYDYGYELVWDGERNYNIENAVSISDLSVDLYDFFKQEVKYILLKYLPYGLKHLSSIATLNFEFCKRVHSEDGRFIIRNLENYHYITENKILDKQSNNYFQFIHIDGSHPPYDLDKNLNAVKNGTYEQQTESALTVIKAYLQRLKDNDAYDNSAIVIMADHGAGTSGHLYRNLEGEYVESGFNPILFIKGINEKHEMLESDRSVSYVDLQDAFCDLIDGKQSTEIFEGLEPGRTRTMLYCHAKRIYHLVEYTTTGMARETEKFTPTGAVYDLKG